MRRFSAALAALVMLAAPPAALALWNGQTGKVVIDIGSLQCLQITAGPYDLQGGECDITATLWDCHPTPSGCECNAHVTATSGDCGDLPLGLPTIWGEIRRH